jgi:hypothetical protein
LTGKAFFAFLVNLAYDLDGLAAGAGHRRKAEGGILGWENTLSSIADK